MEAPRGDRFFQIHPWIPYPPRGIIRHIFSIYDKDSGAFGKQLPLQQISLDILSAVFSNISSICPEKPRKGDMHSYLSSRTAGATEQVPLDIIRGPHIRKNNQGIKKRVVF